MGAWSCLAMVTPFDQLNKTFLANVFVVAFASHFSLKGGFCFSLCFLDRQSFLTNQLTEHSSRQSGDYLPGLVLVVNILLWSKPVFITTRHGFIINRHNMEGVISTQDWGYHLYYNKVGQPMM